MTICPFLRCMNTALSFSQFSISIWKDSLCLCYLNYRKLICCFICFHRSGKADYWGRSEWWRTPKNDTYCNPCCLQVWDHTIRSERLWSWMLSAPGYWSPYAIIGQFCSFSSLNVTHWWLYLCDIWFFSSWQMRWAKLYLPCLWDIIKRMMLYIFFHHWIAEV